MQQRSALEQDVIDLVRESYEIFEKQLEVQASLLEMFQILTANLLNGNHDSELKLTELGVNSKAIASEGKNLWQPTSSESLSR
ncbi:hypothetical protein [Pseudomonas sp. zbq_11]|uniref:hypothetical protein n=1 Tax=Pseudomonas TaxID=286 RepID=UPI00370C2FF7